jgi:hypothetical protein
MNRPFTFDRFLEIVVKAVLSAVVIGVLANVFPNRWIGPGPSIGPEQYRRRTHAPEPENEVAEQAEKQQPAPAQPAALDPLADHRRRLGRTTEWMGKQILRESGQVDRYKREVLLPMFIDQMKQMQVQPNTIEGVYFGP